MDGLWQDPFWQWVGAVGFVLDLCIAIGVANWPMKWEKR